MVVVVNYFRAQVRVCALAWQVAATNMAMTALPDWTASTQWSITTEQRGADPLEIF
jgi:hypothetical protein